MRHPTSLTRLLLSASRGLILCATLAGLLGGLAGTALISVINAALHPDGAPPFALPLTLPQIFLALCLTMVLARLVAAMLVIRLQQATVFGLRMELSRLILGAPYPRLQALGASRLLVNLTEDIAAIATALEHIPWVCVNGATILGCLAYLGWLEPELLAAVLGIMAVGVVGFHLPKRRALRLLNDAREREDALFEHFRDLTAGIKELKLNRARRQDFFDGVLNGTAEAYRRRYVSGQSAYLIGAHFGNSLFFVAFGLILFVAPDYFPLPAATLSGFILTLLYMSTPLTGMLEILPLFGRAGIALDRINALRLALPPERSPRGSAVPSPLRAPKRLELLRVSHSYQREGGDGKFTLGPLDLCLKPGELVFLVGGNGSGKSTLALLVTGLYAPESGRIRLGGVDIDAGNRDHYRQHFSVVFSDFHLFDSLLGFSGDDLDQKAREYLAGLQLDHKVGVADGRFSTRNLSQGQRKRLALLVAYLEDRPFYVFDEWAADQDPVFKRVFYLEILPALKARGKTVLAISHDDQYFHVADRVVRLADGRLIQDAKPEAHAGTVVQALAWAEGRA